MVLLETWPFQVLRTPVGINTCIVHECKDIKKLIELCGSDFTEHRDIELNLEKLIWVSQKFASLCVQSEINKEMFQTVDFKIIEQKIIT
jgi:hypothetical protein